MPMIPPLPPSLVVLGGKGPGHDLGTSGMVVLVIGVTFTVVMVIIAVGIAVRTELDNRRSGKP